MRYNRAGVPAYKDTSAPPILYPRALALWQCGKFPFLVLPYRVRFVGGFVKQERASGFVQRFTLASHLRREGEKGGISGFFRLCMDK